MDPARRLALLRSYVGALAAYEFAAALEDPGAIPDNSPAHMHMAAADACWIAADEDGRNSMRWASAALEAIEDACLAGGVPEPPWLLGARNKDDTRAALASFFAGAGRDARRGVQEDA